MLKLCQLLALMWLFAATACAPAASQRSAAGATQSAAAVSPSQTPTARPGPAPIVSTCPPGKEPAFVLGFAGLKERLGDRMGEPLSCERPGPTGDALQQTTTGVARYRKNTNVPSFTSGDEHWALTEHGLVYWTGRAIDPPADAQAVDGPQVAVRVRSNEAPPAATMATAAPNVATISLAADSEIEVIAGLP